MKLRLAGNSATFRSSLPLASALTVFGPCANAAMYYVLATGRDSKPASRAGSFRRLSKGAFERHRRGRTLSGVPRLELRLPPVSRR